MIPIDLKDYTPERRALTRERGVYCVYAIGRGASNPISIGYTNDLVARYRKLSAAEPSVHCWHVTWVPGKPVATRIFGRVSEILSETGRALEGGGFRLTPEWARKTIVSVAHNLYPERSIKTHRQFLKSLEARDGNKHRTRLTYFRKYETNTKSPIESEIVSLAAQIFTGPLVGVSPPVKTKKPTEFA